MSIRLPAASWTKGTFWCALPLLLLLPIEYGGFALDHFQVNGSTIYDYDSLTRLAYLREVMQRHGWQGGYFSRLNAPYGMHLHWSLPFNAMVLGIAKLFALINPDAALQYAGYWTGTIFRAVIAFAAYWAGRARLSRPASCLAACLILFSPFLMNYGHRGTANYHVLMILNAVLLMGIAMRAQMRADGTVLPLIAGFMMAFSLWSTVELAIMVGPLLLAMFLLWIAEGERRSKQMLLVTASLTIGATLALVIDPAPGGYGAVFYDCVAAPLQTLAAFPFAMAAIAASLPLNTPLRRLRHIAALGAGFAVLWLILYPSAFAGIEGAMDPYVRREWLTTIQEVKPISRWNEIALTLGTGLLCLALFLKWKNKPCRDLSMAALGGLYLLAHVHIRLAGYLIVASAFGLGYVYDQLRAKTGEFPLGLSRYARPAALGLCALFYVFVFDIELFRYDMTAQHQSEMAPNQLKVPEFISCNPYPLRTMLDNEDWMGVHKPDPLVANDTNDAASLLYWTHLRLLAGNYHRDSQGIRDDYMFLRDTGVDDFARTTAKARDIDFVLVCGQGNNGWYAYKDTATARRQLALPLSDRRPEPTLYTRMVDRKPPPWLKLRSWPRGTLTQMLLYQVDKSKLEPARP